MQYKRRKSWWQSLAVLTGVALLGLVGFQGYWLWEAYQKQQRDFEAEMEKSLRVAVIKYQLLLDNPTVKQDEQIDLIAGFMYKLLEGAAQMPIDSPTQLADPSGFEVRPLDVGKTEARIRTDSTQSDTASRGLKIELDFKFLNGSDRASMARFRKFLVRDLQRHGTQTPVELALINKRRQIVQATCTPTTFRDIPFKTLPVYGNFSADSSAIQAAFPEGQGVLVGRLGTILWVSALLILICTVSFTLLLRLMVREKRLAELRTDFMNNMTHELKTPIASVAVAIELVQSPQYALPEAKKTEYLSAAQSELQRLTMLVEKVLKMAAFERSEIHLAAYWFDAVGWVHRIRQSLKPVLEGSGTTLETAVPETMQLYGDETHLTNVVHNLLENALKYGQRSDLQLKLQLRETDTDCWIAVTDNGKGIPARYQEKIFEKFFRVPTGDRHDTKGYGLGLSYVAAIVQLHGGQVSVQSTPLEATTFTIRLPKPATPSA